MAKTLSKHSVDVTIAQETFSTLDLFARFSTTAWPVVPSTTVTTLFIAAYDLGFYDAARFRRQFVAIRAIRSKALFF